VTAADAVRKPVVERDHALGLLRQMRLSTSERKRSPSARSKP